MKIIIVVIVVVVGAGHMPQYIGGGLRTTFGSEVSFSTFMWVPGLTPRWPGLSGKLFYPLRQLPSLPPWCVCITWDSTIKAKLVLRLQAASHHTWLFT